jgi:predicted RNase H-like nuclease (RuvC/YqgF family)
MRSRKQKRSVEKTSPKQKELEKSVSVLRVKLSRTEKALTKAKNRADRWQQEAKAQKKSASRARARVEKLRQKLDEASPERKPVQRAAPVEAVQPAATMETTSAGRPVAEAPTVDAVTVADETWSVVQLRAEARARGLTGMSSKTKGQLLDALS